MNPPSHLRNKAAGTFHFADQLFDSNANMDFEDGIDRPWFAPIAANDVGDFTITGNGSSSVVPTPRSSTLTLNGLVQIYLTVEISSMPEPLARAVKCLVSTWGASQPRVRVWV